MESIGCIILTATIFFVIQVDENQLHNFNYVAGTVPILASHIVQLKV